MTPSSHGVDTKIRARSLAQLESTGREIPLMQHARERVAERREIDSSQSICVVEGEYERVVWVDEKMS